MRLEISGDIHASGFDHTETLRLARRAARHRPTVIALEDVSRLGRRPTEIMAQLARLRRAGVQIRLTSGIANRDSDDQFVPALLMALSAHERQETTRRTSKAVQDARTRGSSSGRPRVMTPERQAMAARMLSQGRRGSRVLTVVRGLGGPNISQSAYYLWQKAWLAGGHRTSPRR